MANASRMRRNHASSDGDDQYATSSPTRRTPRQRDGHVPSRNHRANHPGNPSRQSTLGDSECCHNSNGAYTQDPMNLFANGAIPSICAERIAIGSRTRTRPATPPVVKTGNCKYAHSAPRNCVRRLRVASQPDSESGHPAAAGRPRLNSTPHPVAAAQQADQVQEYDAHTRRELPKPPLPQPDNRHTRTPHRLQA